MSEIVELAKKNKFVTTIYGRKIHVPNIDSPNYMIRQASKELQLTAHYRELLQILLRWQW